MKRLLLMIGAFVLGIGMMASPAVASPSTVSNSQTVWSNGVLCLAVQSEAHSDDTTTVNYSFAATSIAGSGNCTGYSGPEPNTGELAEAMDVWRWDGSRWGVCQSSNWIYSSQPTWADEASTYGTYGPCGEGWYGIYAYGARYVGGGWVGYQTPVWSGQVHLWETPGYSAVRLDYVTLPAVAVPTSLAHLAPG